MYIAQNVFTSNIVTIPVVAAAPPTSTASARPGDPKSIGQKQTGRAADLPRR